MSLDALTSKLLAIIEKSTDEARIFQATVTALSGGLAKIRPQKADTAADQLYARVAGKFIAVGDVVLCVLLGTQPVILGKIQNLTGTPTSTLDANAGSTATRSIVGSDEDFELTIASAGTGQAVGAIIDITWAVPRPSALYNVQLNPKNSATRGLGGVVGQSTTATTHVLIATNTALTAGQSYTWGVHLNQYG